MKQGSDFGSRKQFVLQELRCALQANEDEQEFSLLEQSGFKRIVDELAYYEEVNHEVMVDIVRAKLDLEVLRCVPVKQLTGVVVDDMMSERAAYLRRIILL